MPKVRSIFSRSAPAWTVGLLLLLSAPSWFLVKGKASAAESGMTPDDFLSLGDGALAEGSFDSAIDYYRQGIQVVTEDDSLLTELSLHTNLATALSSVGKNEEAAESYQNSLLSYKNAVGDIVDNDFRRDAADIAAQASFFLGMVYQDLGQSHDAADAYRNANALDPLHWASMANLGAVLHDDLSNHRDALQAYNEAYSILTDPNAEPTDPPGEPRYILSQLQYRIGLCISHNDYSSGGGDKKNNKCAMVDDPDTAIDCRELAANAFSMALQYDPDNESAKHMLATVTADATVKRASNTYVKSLFDDYAVNFEHSLVQELGYTGYERLRRCFDRAFEREEMPTFDVVMDAGCGTGLVGEQFRNVSQRLIGVDLSQAILDEAVKSRPGLYDEVLVGDVAEIMQQQYSGKLSLIIAADSYIYFGDLDPLFSAMEAALQPGGYAAFTLENVGAEDEQMLGESKPDWRWQLTPSGRFAHRKEYVVTTGGRHNLKLIRHEPLENFRYERGVGVSGHAFVMQKLDADGKKGTSMKQEL